jgi:outer membrane protein assembly factor BamD (BamD/ComL family)
MPRRHTLPLVLFLAVGVAAASAPAQSPEFRMDASGNWVQTVAPQPGTDEALIAQARKELAEDRPADAQNTISPWIDKNDRSGNPLMAQALVIRGDALTAQGDEYEALYDYERAIKQFPATQSYITAVERELDIGVRYAGGLRRKLLGVRVLPTSDIGEELLIRVQERMPGSRLAERAGIELADYYYRDHDLSLAVEAYDLFIQNYPSSQYKPRAMQRRIYATIARFKGPRYDGSALIDAKILTRRYVSLYPAEAEKAGLDDGLLTRLDESSGQEMLGTADWYLRRDDDVSARLVLRRLVRDHPRTAAAQKALEIIQSKGWTVQLAGADNTPKPAADLQPGTIDATIKPGVAKPVDAGQTSPAKPGDRPPPVELNRRKPTPTPAEPKQP